MSIVKNGHWPWHPERKPKSYTYSKTNTLLHLWCYRITHAYWIFKFRPKASGLLVNKPCLTTHRANQKPYHNLMLFLLYLSAVSCIDDFFRVDRQICRPAALSGWAVCITLKCTKLQLELYNAAKIHPSEKYNYVRNIWRNFRSSWPLVEGIVCIHLFSSIIEPNNQTVAHSQPSITSTINAKLK